MIAIHEYFDSTFLPEPANEPEEKKDAFISAIPDSILFQSQNQPIWMVQAKTLDESFIQEQARSIAGAF